MNVIVIGPADHGDILPSSQQTGRQSKDVNQSILMDIMMAELEFYGTTPSLYPNNNDNEDDENFEVDG